MPPNPRIKIMAFKILPLSKKETIRQQHAIYKKFFDDYMNRPTENNPEPLPNTDEELTGCAFECLYRLQDLKNGIPYLIKELQHDNLHSRTNGRKAYDLQKVG